MANTADPIVVVLKLRRSFPATRPCIEANLVGGSRILATNNRPCSRLIAAPGGATYWKYMYL